MFEDFKLHDKVLDGLRDVNFREPTPIQEQCIPSVLEGKDIIASSQTGTGKTGAFIIPVISKMMENPGKGIRALILTPTRELAKQIDEQIVAIGYHTGITSVTVYGGGTPEDWNRQERALYYDVVNIVVATPGRLIDHLKIRPADFSNLEYFILDEADRMLDMGFLPDVRIIESRLPRKRQNLLFSATIPNDIEKFIRTFTNQPERINVASQVVAKGIRQIAYKVPTKYKEDLLLHLLNKDEYKSCIVFVGTKRGTEQLARSISKSGIKANSLHGDRSQSEREDALRDFMSGKCNVLVATDVLARGIDINNISHIINYDVPGDLDDYIHRIGRTARAEATGDAVTFVTERDRNRIRPIYMAMKDEMEVFELPEELRKKDDESSDSHRDSKQPSKNGKRRGRSSSSNRGRSPKKKTQTSSKSETENADKSASKSSSGNKGNNNRKKQNQRRRPRNQSSSKTSSGSSKAEPKNEEQKSSQKSKSGNKSSRNRQNRNQSPKRKPGNQAGSSSASEKQGKQDNRSRSKTKTDQNRRRNYSRKKDTNRGTTNNDSFESMKERQRKSLRDAHATKRALMSNEVEPGPNKKGKGFVGILKKIFSGK